MNFNKIRRFREVLAGIGNSGHCKLIHSQVLRLKNNLSLKCVTVKNEAVACSNSDKRRRTHLIV